MVKKLLTLLFLFATPAIIFSQLPDPVLVGYFHNWQDVNAPYIQLDQVDGRYNVIDVAFAVPHTGTDYRMEFVPDQVSQPTFISQVQTLQSQGRKVLISIGGATAPVSLDNASERDTFVITMISLLQQFGFDGIDIDLEGASVSTSGGNISSPVDQPIINLIDAIKLIMSGYYLQTNKHLMLTMAPEAAYVQGGMSAYGGIWGGYLPVIDALRDSLDLLHVQLYNTGSLLGIDGQTYSQGTADFIVAMTEAVIQGFNTGGGMFNGLLPSKVAVGLPACSMAAGGGFADTTTVRAAINYLRGVGPKPGTYTLFDSSGYQSLRGMMTWSINWDATNNCNSVYEFANNFTNIFSIQSGIMKPDEKIFNLFPNPANEFLQIKTRENNFDRIKIFNSMFQLMYSEKFMEKIDVSKWSDGIYYINCENDWQRIFIQH